MTLPARIASRLALLVLGALLVATLPLAAQTGTWTPVGPEGGTVTVFAAPDAQHVYLGTDVGGVYRSADGGRTWSPAFAGFGNLAVTALAVDPVDPNVVYAGAGDGFYKTVTGGAAWVRFTAGLDPLAQVLAVAVDPTVRSRVYAGTPFGLYRSTNGGRRWARVADVPNQVVRALAVRADGTVLAGVSTSPVRLFQSADGGTTWSEQSGAFPNSFGSSFDGLALDASAASVVYARLSSTLFRSADGGRSFDEIPGLAAAAADSFAVAPRGTLYVGTQVQGVLRSDDGGASFHPAAELGPTAVAPAFSATAVGVTADGAVLAGIRGRGVLRQGVGVRFWRYAGRGLTASRVLALSLDRARPETVYAGILGRGLVRSLDAGGVWQEQNAGLAPAQSAQPLNVTAIAADPRRPDRLYAGVTGAGLSRSLDGGLTFEKVQDFSDFGSLGFCNTPVELAVDPRNGTLFAGIAFDFRLCNQYCRAWRSTDGGDSFQCLTGGPGDLPAIAFDLLSPNLTYASDGTGVFRTTDAGATFGKVSPGIDDQHWITALLVDPANGRRLLAGTRPGGVSLSGDRGATWATPILGNGALSATTLVADPATGRLYAGITGEGIFASGDHGATWSPLGDGLPPGAFSGPLVLDERNRVLYVGTGGSGVYRLELGR